MKAIKFLLRMCFCLVVASCMSDRVREYVQVTYGNSAGGEFSVAHLCLGVNQMKDNRWLVRVFPHLFLAGWLCFFVVNPFNTGSCVSVNLYNAGQR